ncbi:MAG: phosphoribosylformylglycinamidine synthase subunit PurQ [Hyphomicrobiales bacterium]|nr:phosphoribosylformylglycinamidine synthase subunit PurQ [Hyphomicrobiales bacterium]
MSIAVITFPASNCDRDAAVAVEALGGRAMFVHHGETSLPGNLDAVILPGGFSYGDYLRPGCMAAHSPIMREIKNKAEAGMPVLGICNGFQLLTEAGLLPGALLRNHDLLFIYREVHLLVERNISPFMHLYRQGAVVTMPIAHKDGNYYVDAETLKRIEGEGRIVLRYCSAEGNANIDANPNGSLNNIAALCNGAGNVLGMMPHPERCADAVLGNTDGEALLRGLLQA